MIVNQKELAQCLGISTRQVRNLKQDGMFQQAEGNRGYSLEKCVQEYIDFKINAELGRSASISKEKIQASPRNVPVPPAPINPSHTYNRCSTRSSSPDTAP